MIVSGASRVGFIPLFWWMRKEGFCGVANPSECTPGDGKAGSEHDEGCGHGVEYSDHSESDTNGVVDGSKEEIFTDERNGSLAACDGLGDDFEVAAEEFCGGDFPC